MGAVTGMTLEFEFGQNWAYFSRFIGDTFGAALLIEGITAFIVMPLLAVLLVGYFRLLPKLGIIAIILSSIPTAKSVLMLTNSYHVKDVHAEKLVAWSTIIAAVTVTFWVMVAGMIYPSYFAYYAMILWYASP